MQKDITNSKDLEIPVISQQEEEEELKQIMRELRENTISRFKNLLKLSIQEEVTDIMLVAKRSHYWRCGGRLMASRGTIWTPKELEILASYLLTGYKDGYKDGEIGNDEPIVSAELSYQIDLSDEGDFYATPEDSNDSQDPEILNQDLLQQPNLHNPYLYEEKTLQRFRVSLFKEKGNFRIVLRVVPTEIRSLPELNLPSQLEEIVKSLRGLVLVTGATGNGKSTTISAMLEHINRTQVVHIITLEDPIEFIYREKLSVVTQREVLSENRYFYDVKDYSKGIREALRQSPDVIMVGEIRDAATFEAVLTAAESGHLVISAIHTADVMATLEKIISYYPQHEGKTILNRLSRSLTAIISQRLLPANSVKVSAERVPAVEIMKVVAGTAECFRTHEKINEIPEKIKGGKDLYGMQSFDQHIIELVKQDFITIDTAMSYASSPGEVQSQLTKLGKFISKR